MEITDLGRVRVSIQQMFGSLGVDRAPVEVELRRDVGRREAAAGELVELSNVFMQTHRHYVRKGEDNEGDGGLLNLWQMSNVHY